MFLSSRDKEILAEMKNVEIQAQLALALENSAGGRDWGRFTREEKDEHLRKLHSYVYQRIVPKYGIDGDKFNKLMHMLY
jgi:hypothetical protein